MPTKNSHVRGVRIADKVSTEIDRRRIRKGWSFNKWMNYVISLGLRSHTKGE